MCGAGATDGETQLEEGIKRLRNQDEGDTKSDQLSEGFSFSSHKVAKISF
jgi:hypothetical protein